jgi:hypothetical protein
MLTKTNVRAIAIAGKSRKARGKSFTSGLLLGLGSASLFLASELPRPRAPKEGFASDWKAIGDGIRDAFKRYGG